MLLVLDCLACGCGLCVSCVVFFWGKGGGWGGWRPPPLSAAGPTAADRHRQPHHTRSQSHAAGDEKLAQAEGALQSPAPLFVQDKTTSRLVVGWGFEEAFGARASFSSLRHKGWLRVWPRSIGGGDWIRSHTAVNETQCCLPSYKTAVSADPTAAAETDRCVPLPHDEQHCLKKRAKANYYKTPPKKQPCKT